MGLEYGPAHRGLESVAVGHDGSGRPEVLARVVLPGCVAATREQYVLHPSVLDCALQGLIGLSLDAQTGSERTYLPFAVEEVRVWSACADCGWAWVRLSAGGSLADAVRKVDVDVCDEQGAVCVRLSGFSVRALEGEIARPVAAETAADEVPSGTLMLMPVWDVVAVEQGAASPAGGEQVVIIGGTAAQRAALQRHVPAARLLDVAAGAEVETLQRHLRELGAIDHLIWVAPAGDGVPIIDDAVIAAQEHGVLQCFRLFKALSGLGYGGKAFAWTLITTQAQAVRRSDAMDPRHAAVHGFAGSLAKEYGHWTVRLIDLAAQEVWPVAELLRLPADRDGSGWGYRGGEWYRQRVVPGEVSRAAGTLYRRGGVYVVIGGAGGLGEAWSEYMIGAYGAQIVWIGRRSLDAAIEAKLDRLSGLGPRPLYLCADASDRAALQAACEEVRRYGQIHGVIHSAIVLQDKSLQHMSESTFRAALSAKVDVSVRLAQVFAGAGLDFVLFFSSLQSVIRAAGQSNYAAGCTRKTAQSPVPP